MVALIRRKDEQFAGEPIRQILTTAPGKQLDKPGAAMLKDAVRLYAGDLLDGQVEFEAFCNLDYREYAVGIRLLQ